MLLLHLTPAEYELILYSMNENPFHSYIIQNKKLSASQTFCLPHQTHEIKPASHGISS